MHVQTERVLSESLISEIYPAYVRAWDHLLVHAAARHVLSPDEFTDEMTDERIEKYLVIADDDRVLGLATLTSDMTIVPWINAHFYTSRYPDAVARNGIFYVGYALVNTMDRGSRAMSLLVQGIDQRVREARGVVGFDLCGFNREHGIGRRPERLFPSSEQIDSVDTQAYYVADYRSAQHLHAKTDVDGDPFRTTTLAERPELLTEIPGLMAGRWNAFMLEGRPGHGVDLLRLLTAHAENQIALLDNRDVLCGIGFCVPLAWNGRLEDLPEGWDGAVEASARLLADDSPANTFCALSITLARELGGRQLGQRMIQAMVASAAGSGARSFVAPVRPTLKPRYPLVALADYVTWQTDGFCFDPWLRVHVDDLGGEILGIAPVSMTITGSVGEWEGWTGMRLPASGRFVIPGGLDPLVVDLANDLGTYQEANVWVRHVMPSRAVDGDARTTSAP